MENKSSMGRVIDNGNTPGASPFIQVANKGPNADQMGNGNERPWAGSGSGYTGPGVGNAKRLNSDGQMPVPPGGGCT